MHSGSWHEAVHVHEGAGDSCAGSHPLRLLPGLQEAHDGVLQQHKPQLRLPEQPWLAQGLLVLQLHQDCAVHEHDLG